MTDNDKNENLMKTFLTVRKICSRDHLTTFFQPHFLHHQEDFQQIFMPCLSKINESNKSMSQILTDLFDYISLPEKDEIYQEFIKYCHEEKSGFQKVLNVLDENEQKANQMNAIAHQLHIQEVESLQNQLTIEYNKRREAEIHNVALQRSQDLAVSRKKDLEIKLKECEDKFEKLQEEFSQLEKEKLSHCDDEMIDVSCECDIQPIEMIDASCVCDIQPIEMMKESIRSNKGEISQINDNAIYVEPDFDTSSATLPPGLNSFSASVYYFCDLPPNEKLHKIKLGSKVKVENEIGILVWTGWHNKYYHVIVDFEKSKPGRRDGSYNKNRLYHSRFTESCDFYYANECEPVSQSSRMPGNVKSCNIDSLLLEPNHLGCSLRVRDFQGREIQGRLCWCGKINGIDHIVLGTNEPMKLNTQWMVAYESKENRDKFALFPASSIVSCECRKNSSASVIARPKSALSGNAHNKRNAVIDDSFRGGRDRTMASPRVAIVTEKSTSENEEEGHYEIIAES